MAKDHSLQETILRKMIIECEKRNGINLTHGIIDTEPPLVLLDAAQKAIRDGKNIYTSLYGDQYLRNAISHKLKKYNHVDYSPVDEIIVTAGASGAFFCTILGLLNSGDEILVFEPFYPYHVNVLLSLGIKPVFIELNPPDWSFEQKEIIKQINKNTKAILVNTPSNPTGKVFNREELKAIAKIADLYNLLVITDEVYEYFVYDSINHISPASIPGLKERTVTISSFSKTFSITGWRIGYIACNKILARKLAYINEQIYLCASAPLQVGVATAIYSLTNQYYENLKGRCSRNLALISNSLKIANLEPLIPQGSFYILANLSRLPGQNDFDKAIYLLESASVGSVPCSAFLSKERNVLSNYSRFSFGVNEEKIVLACRQLENNVQ